MKSLNFTSLFFLLIFLTAFSCASRDKETFSEKEWAQTVEQTSVEDLYAGHEKNHRFFAPWMIMKDKSFFDVLKWRLFSKTDYSEEEKIFLPRVLPDTLQRLKQTKGNFICWIGHNTFLIRIDNVYWMTDPIFSKRALLPARVTPPAISLDALNKFAENINVVISHNHYDHLDKASIKGLHPQTKVFVPKGLKDYVKKMDKPNVKEMDWWEEQKVGKDSTLICLPAQHWSMRITQARNASLWASYLLITPDVTLYFGGDSGYFKGFREFGRKFPRIDYAFMATTAYHPRWFMHYQHMNIEESVKAFEELGATYFIPTQWGTFHLGSEPAGYPGLDLKRYIKKHRLNPLSFKIMDIGQILPIEQIK